MFTELQLRVLTGERPLDGYLSGVSSWLPRFNLALQMLSAFDAPVQALTIKDTDLDPRHVQPTRVFGCVVELHPAQELGRCAFAQHVVEALSEVEPAPAGERASGFHAHAPPDDGRAAAPGRRWIRG